jgi:hypothetical protein
MYDMVSLQRRQTVSTNFQMIHLESGQDIYPFDKKQDGPSQGGKTGVRWGRFLFSRVSPNLITLGREVNCISLSYIIR